MYIMVWADCRFCDLLCVVKLRSISPCLCMCDVCMYIYVFSSGKQFKVDSDDTVVTIESRLKLMTQKMSQLVNSWNEQTRGLHLDSDGKLRGLLQLLCD